MPKNRKGYDKEHYEKNRDRKRSYNSAYWHRFRKATFELLGGVCSHCGFSDVRALQIDHVNGGGTKELRTNTKNYSRLVFLSVSADEGKYQLLCANCNWIKRHIRGEQRK